MSGMYKAPCPSCHRECNTDVIGRKEQTWNQDFGGNSVYGEVDHLLLECCGCNTIFYLRKSWDTESISHDTIIYQIVTFPPLASPRATPEWLYQVYSKDKRLYRILSEVYEAYERESYILASIGLRTAFECATEALDVETGYPMVKKVALAFEKGFIGIAEREQLMILTEAGNAAAHRGWHPSEDEFKSLLKILENFIHRTVLNADDLQYLAHTIPKKQKFESKDKKNEK
jgi:hypothetical protein